MMFDYTKQIVVDNTNKTMTMKKGTYIYKDKIIVTQEDSTVSIPSAGYIFLQDDNDTMKLFSCTFSEYYALSNDIRKTLIYHLASCKIDQSVLWTTADTSTLEARILGKRFNNTVFFDGFSTYGKIVVENNILTLKSGLYVFGLSSCVLQQDCSVELKASSYVYLQSKVDQANGIVYLACNPLSNINQSDMSHIIGFVTSGLKFVIVDPSIRIDNINHELIEIKSSNKSTSEQITELTYLVNNKSDPTVDTYPELVYGGINANTGTMDTSNTSRLHTTYIPYNNQSIKIANGYLYYIMYYDEDKKFVKSNGWLNANSDVEECAYFAILIGKSNAVFENTINTFLCFPSVLNSRFEAIESKVGKIFTVGENDNVAQIVTEAMQYNGSIVYILPYVHDCYQEWEDYFGAGYFENLSTGRGIELCNDIHIIGRSGNCLKLYYTGDSDYVQSEFSLFNNKPGGSGYTIENVFFDTKKIRYVIHDERATDSTPYKVHYLRCRMKQDNSESTWDHSRACIGGGLGAHGDVVVEDCIFDTVVSEANKDSIAYHNSAHEQAESSIVIKNCYCEGTSTLQLAAYGKSAALTKVIVANCSFGSAIEEYVWTGVANFDIKYINNEIRS